MSQAFAGKGFVEIDRELGCEGSQAIPGVPENNSAAKEITAIGTRYFEMTEEDFMITSEVSAFCDPPAHPALIDIAALLDQAELEESDGHAAKAQELRIEARARLRNFKSGLIPGSLLFSFTSNTYTLPTSWQVAKDSYAGAAESIRAGDGELAEEFLEGTKEVVQELAGRDLERLTNEAREQMKAGTLEESTLKELADILKLAVTLFDDQDLAEATSEAIRQLLNLNFDALRRDMPCPPDPSSIAALLINLVHAVPFDVDGSMLEKQMPFLKKSVDRYATANLTEENRQVMADLVEHSGTNPDLADRIRQGDKIPAAPCNVWAGTVTYKKEKHFEETTRRQSRYGWEDVTNLLSTTHEVQFFADEQANVSGEISYQDITSVTVVHRGEIKCNNGKGTQRWDIDHLSRAEIKGQGSSTNASIGLSIRGKQASLSFFAPSIPGQKTTTLNHKFSGGCAEPENSNSAETREEKVPGLSGSIRFPIETELPRTLTGSKITDDGITITWNLKFIED